MQPGGHIVLVSGEASVGTHGRYKGWELRDTLLILASGPTLLFAHLLRVPLQESTVAAQVLKTGTGGLNIDACRVASGGEHFRTTVEGRSGGAVHQADPRRGAALGMYQEGKGFEPTNSPLGRWPSNLLLVHAEGCRCEGAKKVKNVGGSTSGESAFGQDLGWNAHNNRTTEITRNRDQDGLETVPNWVCVEGCPVPLLDRQSGSRELGKFVGSQGVKRKSTMMDSTKGWNVNSLDNNKKNSPNNYGDPGGASRFYPQFKNLLEALDWLTRLTNP